MGGGPSSSGKEATMTNPTPTTARRKVRKVLARVIGDGVCFVVAVGLGYGALMMVGKPAPVQVQGHLVQIGIRG